MRTGITRLWQAWRRTHSRWFAPLVETALFVVGFAAFTKVLGKFSGIGTTSHFFALELPLAVLLFLAGYIALRPSPFRGAVAAVPLVVVYLLHDFYYVSYGHPPRLVEVSELPELFAVLDVRTSASLFAAAAPLAVFAASVQWRSIRWLLVAAALLAAVVATGRQASAVAGWIEQHGSITRWSDQRSARDTGRMMTLVYQEARRRQVLGELMVAGGGEGRHPVVEARVDSLAAVRASAAPDVHLIVLESFLDPSLLSGVRFSRPPASDAFAALFGDAGSLVASPVFGGRSAQAEFEVLCGVPAFARFSSIEFNLFSGAPIDCLPRLLGAAGFETMATNAFRPDFFNAGRAYRSAGFDHIYFPREYGGGDDSYLTAGGGPETFMFDGRLFEQNLAFLREHRGRRPPESPPLFNYVLGLYGHHPHELEDPDRPAVIEIEGSRDDLLRRYVNQYYYRTEALARYVHGLLELQPRSLIIVASDHLPPLASGPASYAALNYLGNRPGAIYYNRLYVLEDGRPRPRCDASLFELSDWIVDHVTSGEHCRRVRCGPCGTRTERDSYLGAYVALMSRALR